MQPSVFSRTPIRLAQTFVKAARTAQTVGEYAKLAGEIALSLPFGAFSWNEALQIKERDHYACTNPGCNHSHKQGYMLHAAHFDHNRFNPDGTENPAYHDLENGTSLCMECHARQHFAYLQETGDLFHFNSIVAIFRSGWQNSLHKWYRKSDEANVFAHDRSVLIRLANEFSFDIEDLLTNPSIGFNYSRGGRVVSTETLESEMLIPYLCEEPHGSYRDDLPFADDYIPDEMAKYMPTMPITPNGYPVIPPGYLANQEYPGLFTDVDLDPNALATMPPVDHVPVKPLPPLRRTFTVDNVRVTQNTLWSNM